MSKTSDESLLAYGAGGGYSSVSIWQIKGVISGSYQTRTI